MWSVEPSVQASVIYVDNIFMQQTSPISSTGWTAAPRLDLTRRTETTTANFGGYLVLYRYSEDEIRDSSVRVLTFSGNSKARRSSLDWNGFYKSDTTVTAITEVVDTVDEDEGGDTDDLDGLDGLDGGAVDLNLVDVEIRRNQLRVQPSWSRAITQTSFLRLGYSLNDVRYSGRGDIPLDDYRTHTVDVALSRQINRRDAVDAGVSVSRYDVIDEDIRSDDYTVKLNLRRQFSPNLRGSFGAGVRSTTISRGTEESESSGGVVDAGLIGRPSRSTSYRVSLERSLRPSGARAIVLSDQLRVNVSHDVTPTLTLSLRGRAYRNESIDSTQPFADRTFYSIDTGFQKAITRFWSIDGSYRYRWQKFEGADDSADSNTVYLAVNYRWKGYSLSR